MAGKKRPRRPLKDVTGLWQPVRGRRPGTPRRVLGRDKRGRFKKVDAGPLPHWRIDLPPAAVTYHREEKSGRTYYRAWGKRATPEVAQHLVALAIQDRFSMLGLARYLGDLEPAVEDAEESDFVEWEANDGEVSILDVQAAYELAGAERGFNNDADDDVDPGLRFSGTTPETLEAYWRGWEAPLRVSKFGRWSMAGKKIGVAVSYYALAHKVVYESAAAFGVLVRTPFAPLGREAYMVLRERMEKLESRSDEDVEWVVGGFWVRFKVLAE